MASRECTFTHTIIIRMPDGSRIPLEELSQEDQKAWRERMIAKTVDILLKDYLEPPA